MSDPILETVGRLVPAARALRVTPLLRAPDGAAPSWPAEVEAFFARPGPILCASGALHPQYGFEDLFAAVAALRRDGRPVRLVLLLGSFATEAPTAKALKEAATSLGDGTILALRDFAEGASIIARSQLYVRPSRVDSYGLALHEAMLLGVPVVASAHPTRPEGVLAYPAGDAAALARRIESGLEPAARAAAAGRVARLRADVDANAARTLAILAEVCAEVPG